jgi:signal transduction histidine kinase
MSLRLRLILSFALLMLLLGAAAGWGLQLLGRELDAAIDETAESVGRAVVTVLRERQVVSDSAPDAGVADPPGPPPRRRVIVDGRELSEREMAVLPPLPREIDIRVERGGDAPALLRLRGDGLQQGLRLSQAPQQAIERFTRQLGWGLLGLFALGALAAAVLAARISRPLRALGEAAEQVGRGELGLSLPEQGPREVRQSIAAFNRMSADLARLDAEATRLRGDRELAELGEIGRGLAHSLRSPLHALGLSLEALAAASPQEPRSAERLATGRAQLARIDQALRGFLALSAGAEPESLRLRSIIDDVVLEASQQAAGRVHFVREGDDLGIRGVAAELRIVLHTLVVNALQASPDGGRVTVRLGPAPPPGAPIVVEVLDDGSGIPAALRPRLFEPHVSDKPSGAGMGLFLAERIVRLRHGGRLSLLDRAPTGTVARLELYDRVDSR